MKPQRINKANWENLIETVCEHTGKDTPIWSCVANYYSVCIPSLITPLSARLWTLYRRIEGTAHETFESYSALPAIWADACAVIDNEIARIDKIKADKAANQQTALMGAITRRS